MCQDVCTYLSTDLCAEEWLGFLAQANLEAIEESQFFIPDCSNPGAPLGSLPHCCSNAGVDIGAGEFPGQAGYAQCRWWLAIGVSKPLTSIQNTHFIVFLVTAIMPPKFSANYPSVFYLSKKYWRHV